jgi:hypothetical protein
LSVRYAEDHILLNWPSTGTSAIRIMDVAGRDVFVSSAALGSYRFERAILASGTYLVAVTAGAEQFSGRLVLR